MKKAGSRAFGGRSVKSTDLGSQSSVFGARRAIVEEPLSWEEEYPIQWREPKVDLAELAKLRWIEGFSKKELAKRLGRTEDSVQNHFQILRRMKFLVPGLTDNDRKKILWALKN